MAKPFIIFSADVRNKYHRLSDEDVKNAKYALRDLRVFLLHTTIFGSLGSIYVTLKSK